MNELNFLYLELDLDSNKEKYYKEMMKTKEKKEEHTIIIDMFDDENSIEIDI